MPFTSCGGCLKDIFITEYEIIDRYVGNQLWAWGSGACGRLGNNSVASASSPVQTISGGTNWKQVCLGAGRGSGIKTDGTLWLWGSSQNGRLGNNTLGTTSSPVQTISGGTNWKQVALGDDHSAAIKTDGTLWTWGLNIPGSLGTNSTISQSSPVQTISGGTNWKQVSSQDSMSAAIKTDGTLWLWGAGTCGRLGNNSTANQSSPVQTVSGGTNWKQISVGCVHTAAIKTDSTLWTWGLNNNGQLGDNSTTNRSSPVQTVSGGTNWKQLSAGDNLIGAIKTDGTLWLWGTGANGRLGTNSIESQSSPVQTISGGTNWKQADVSDVTAAIKTDGTLWLWGLGSFGRLGTNAITDQSSPVQTVSGGTNWKQINTARCHVGAVTFTES